MARQNKAKQPMSVEEADRIVDRLIKLYAEEHGLNYTDAFTAYQKEKPEVFQSWENIRRRGVHETDALSAQFENFLDAEIKKYAASHQVDYSAAFVEIQKTIPDLIRAWNTVTRRERNG